MTRPPDVDPDLIRQVMSRRPRPTARAAARELAELLNKPVSVSLIYSAIKRHPEWQLDAPPGSGSVPALDYRCERALGPIHDEHKGSHDWIMLTAYERAEAGLLASGRKSAIDSQGYVSKRLRLGQVTDYHQSSGFYTRIALPWEKEAGSYLRMPAPECARLEVEMALRDRDLPEEVRKYWKAWLDMDRAATGSLPVKGRG